MLRSTKRTLLALPLVTLALAGCATLTPAPPLNSSGAVRALPAIQYNDYCEAQKKIAEHNSRRDTLRTGKRVVYKAPCELSPPGARPPHQPRAPGAPEAPEKPAPVEATTT